MWLVDLLCGLIEGQVCALQDRLVPSLPAGLSTASLSCWQQPGSSVSGSWPRPLWARLLLGAARREGASLV